LKLSAYAERYILTNELSPATQANYRREVRSFARWIGRDIELSELSDELVSEWIVGLQARGLNPKTVRNMRANIVALWNAAFYDRYIETEPRRVRKVKVPIGIPEAWTPDELSRLIGVARVVKGRIRKWRLSLSDYMLAFILTAYDSGLRLGDLMALRRKSIREDGSLAIVQSKTGYPIFVTLRPETVECLDKIHHERREKLFGGVLSRRCFFIAFNRVAKLAGLEGTSRKLRRTGATLIERAQPGAASAFLGHRPGSPVAQRHYIDPFIARTERPMPPAVNGHRDDDPVEQQHEQPPVKIVRARLLSATTPALLLSGPAAPLLTPDENALITPEAKAEPEAATEPPPPPIVRQPAPAGFDPMPTPRPRYIRPITPSQEITLRYIAKCIAETGKSPGRPTIVKATGMKNANEDISCLILKGMMEKLFAGRHNLGLTERGKQYIGAMPHEPEIVSRDRTAEGGAA